MRDLTVTQCRMCGAVVRELWTGGGKNRRCMNVETDTVCLVDAPFHPKGGADFGLTETGKFVRGRAVPR